MYRTFDIIAHSSNFTNFACSQLTHLAKETQCIEKARVQLVSYVCSDTKK